MRSFKKIYVGFAPIVRLIFVDIKYMVVQSPFWPGPTPRISLRRALRCWLVVCLMNCMSAFGHASLSDELLVKAGFLVNFAKFVEWPVNSGPFAFCVVGDDRVAESLETGLSGKTILSRPVAVRNKPALRDLPLCNVVYIGRAEKKIAAQIAQSLAGKPILIVSEFPELGSQGVTISFFSDQERIRFEIHMGAVNRSGLKISSKLLQLARVVDDSK